MRSTDNFCDVLVIGGGPAGTTAANLLAKKGWRVSLFEKGEHPKFHIGESLLPMNLPIFDELGVLDEVAKIGVRKNAASFTSTSVKAKPTRFAFSKALRGSPPHAYQVQRSKLDALLFDNCRKSGVKTHENHTVVSATPDSDGRHTVVVRDVAGNEQHWQCRFLIDASGQDSLLAKQNSWRTTNSRHSAAAVFGHFSDVPVNDGQKSGDIDIYWFEHGWMWFIPLGDNLMSIGVVASPEYLKTRQGSLDEFLAATVKKSFAARKRFRNAVALRSAQAIANYSYSSVRHTGPGYALIGDAHTFIDPVFSSGVYLAMSGASKAVPMVDAWLNNQRIRHRFRAIRYERTMKRAVRAFSWFIYRFTTPQMEYLFQNPRNVLGVERAVISMLAGDVYTKSSVHLRLLVFKAIFFLTGFFMPTTKRQPQE